MHHERRAETGALRSFSASDSPKYFFIFRRATKEKRDKERKKKESNGHASFQVCVECIKKKTKEKGRTRRRV